MSQPLLPIPDSDEIDSIIATDLIAVIDPLNLPLPEVVVVDGMPIVQRSA